MYNYKLFLHQKMKWSYKLQALFLWNKLKIAYGYVIGCFH